MGYRVHVRGAFHAMQKHCVKNDQVWIVPIRDRTRCSRKIGWRSFSRQPTVHIFLLNQKIFLNDGYFEIRTFFVFLIILMVFKARVCTVTLKNVIMQRFVKKMIYIIRYVAELGHLEFRTEHE